MAPGADARCIASLPSDIDLVCGAHASLSDGTRSSTRLVVLASDSNSWMSSSMVIFWPPSGGHTILSERTFSLHSRLFADNRTPVKRPHPFPLTLAAARLRPPTVDCLPTATVDCRPPTADCQYNPP